MKKLSKTQIAFLATYMTQVEKAYQTQIYFCFTDVNSGEEAFNLLKDVYGDECNYEAWGGWFGWGDKRDFYLGFTTKQTRDDVYKDIKNALDAYRDTDQYQEEYLGSGSGTGSSETQTSKAGTWAIYLAIGAVAVIILLLLWDKLKK